MHTVKFTDWWRGFKPKKDPLFYEFLFNNYPLKMANSFSRNQVFCFVSRFLAKKTQKGIQRLQEFIIAGNL